MSNRLFWGLIIMVCLAIACMFGAAVNTAHKNGGHLYIITIHTFNGDQTYWSDKIIQQNANCVTFEYLSIKQTICGNYSITEF